MTSINSRLIEKDVFLNLYSSTQGGNSSLVDLNYARSYSVQLIFSVDSVSSQNFSDSNVNTSTDRITITGHGLVTGLKVTLTVTGTLPSPLAVLTNYYVIAVDSNTISLATSLANALAGTAINLTTAGSSGVAVVVVPASLDCFVSVNKSNDGLNWLPAFFGLQIVASGTDMLEEPDVDYRYLKLNKEVNGGSVSLQAKIVVIGDEA